MFRLKLGLKYLSSTIVCPTFVNIAHEVEFIATKFLFPLLHLLYLKLFNSKAKKNSPPVQIITTPV